MNTHTRGMSPRKTLVVFIVAVLCLGTVSTLGLCFLPGTLMQVQASTTQ